MSMARCRRLPLREKSANTVPTSNRATSTGAIMSNAQGTQQAKGGSLSRIVLYGIAIGAIVAAGWYYMSVVRESEPTPVDELGSLRAAITKIPLELKMSDSYRDADGDLVADAPSDANKLQKIEEIGFCLV